MLGVKSSNPDFQAEGEIDGEAEDVDEEDGDGDDGFIGTDGQIFQSMLMNQLHHSQT